MSDAPAPCRKNLVKPMETRSLLLTLAVASVLSAAGTASAQQPAAPDTSEWTCSKCPFDRGYRSEVEVGAAYVNEDSAKFGDYTGLDEKGGYAIVNAEGRASKESGYVLDYEITDLGLESREIRLGGGKQGRYDFELFYDRIPHSIWDTTETPFRGIGSTDLTLPAGWVDAGSTGGMTALDSSLRSVDIGYDRDRYGVAGRYWLLENAEFTVDYRRDQRDGTRAQLASFGSVSAQLPVPVDDATDRLDATLRYDGAGWFLQAGYSGSVYDTKAAALRWDNPFNAMVPGAEVGQMALAPDNQYHEVGASGGWYGLPWNTTVAVSVASGKGTQDTGFLPYTINPNLATDPLPARNLDGEMKVQRADLTLSSRPIDRLRLRGSVAWDERDNDTRQRSYTSIVHTDLFEVIEDRVNPVYGFERLRLAGGADYRIYDDLSVGVGGEYRETDRKGTAQEVRSESQLDGWGVVQYRPSGYLGFVLKGGAKEREPDRYDLDVAAANGQNPLLRKYNMAYLYRSYGEMLVDVSFGNLPLTLGASGFYGDDSYNFSSLGVGSGLDRRYGVDLTWAVNEKVSLFVNGGQEKIDVRTQGSSVFGDPDWRSTVKDDFTTYGGGMRAQFADDVRLDLSYTHAEGESDTTIEGVSAGRFPTVTSDLDSVRADFSYGLTDRLDVTFSWWYERFDSSDWALDGIAPATLPTILALGAEPWEYRVNYVGASVRYYFGSRKLEIPE
jgi:MtrB/PioB family decaheme-associated outer membrane protein